MGGGLGIDYDGSQTNFESSMNYTWQEYASDVVYHIQTVCDEVGVPHPHIITESGRAVAAFHSVLVFGTLGVTNQGEITDIPHEIPDQYEQPLHDLLITYQEANARNILETYHDAIQALETATTLFSAGYLPIDQRVIAENLYFAILHKIRRLVQDLDYVPRNSAGLIGDFPTSITATSQSFSRFPTVGRSSSCSR